tara:strand:+ start:673 stop:1398 length:726 start_codon:yes stop_codon:yes gene_type:complete
MILITRPKPEAKKLKRMIEDLGYHTHIDSLSKIANLKININSNSKKIILISSQRAAKIIIKKHSIPLNMPLLVIGDVSYHKLKLFGFSKILYNAKDSNQLLKYLKKNFGSIKKRYSERITYITGSVSNQNFIKRLNKFGYNVEKKIIYKTKFKKSFNSSTVQLLKNKKIRICLIYSQQNAVQFCKLVVNKNLFHQCKNLLILTLSKNISQVMKKNGYLKVINSAQPTQTSLMKKLKKGILL